jgi:hypothetical protein
MARANLEALGLRRAGLFVQADLTESLPLSPQPGMALFLDPARRVGGRRIYSVNEYQPPLKIIQDWLDHFPALGVKISPGVKMEEISLFRG